MASKSVIENSQLQKNLKTLVNINIELMFRG
jgi:hypothetical protein